MSFTVIKKMKIILLNYLFIFINNQIKNIYNGNIGHNIFKKQLLKINKKQIRSSKSNKILLKKTLKEIFSEDDILSENDTIPENNKPYSENYIHNRNLIEQLLNEEDKEKRVFFIKLFNLSFIDCLNHLGGKNIEQL